MNKMADKTSAADETSALFLGIDFGTTSVKATLLDSVSGKVLMFKKEDTKAGVISDQGIFCQHSEQNVCLIFAALNRILNEFTEETLRLVEKIGICGQMHGCVLWKKEHENFNIDNWNNKLKDKKLVSQLITWEDQRCSPDFISSLPTTKNSLPLSTGFGCATIFWLARNFPNFLLSYDCAGTIQDFLVAMLCGLSEPLMSTQNAFSWGYYDRKQRTWEKETLQQAGFPIHFLPKVCEPGTIAGVLPRSYFGIPAGTHIAVALGDLQCSVLASLEHITDAVLNVGTSSQIAVVIPDQELFQKDVLPGIQFWPFFNDKVLAVGASLTGGNALATFVVTLEKWMKELGIFGMPNKELLYEKLLKCALEKTSTTLETRPTLWGERHDANLTGSISHISESNISLGDITASLCNGIISNLQRLMPKEWLISCGIQRIVGTGNALTQNIILQKQAEKVWGLQLVIKEGSDASHGAALAITST